MNVKGVKDGTEHHPNVVLNINAHRGAATSVLLSNYIKVPDKLEGTFIVLLAHGSLVNRVVEIHELSRSKFDLKSIQYNDERSSMILDPEGSGRGVIPNALWVLE